LNHNSGFVCTEHARVRDSVAELSRFGATMRSKLISIDQAVTSNAIHLVLLCGAFAKELQPILCNLNTLVQHFPSVDDKMTLRQQLDWPLAEIDCLWLWCRQQAPSPRPQIPSLIRALEEMAVLLGGCVPALEPAIPSTSKIPGPQRVTIDKKVATKASIGSYLRPFDNGTGSKSNSKKDCIKTSTKATTKANIGSFLRPSHDSTGSKSSSKKDCDKASDKAPTTTSDRTRYRGGNGDDGSDLL
jgi:hypothetical protein